MAFTFDPCVSAAPWRLRSSISTHLPMFARGINLHTGSLLALMLSLICVPAARAQTIASSSKSDGADPIRLFEQGQDAHQRGDYSTALGLYERATSLRPEFPEAEYQKALALIELNRVSEAKDAFGRAVAQRPGWPLAYLNFGAALARSGKHDRDAEPILRTAIDLEKTNKAPVVALAEVRRRAGDLKEALALLRTATEGSGASPHAWRARAWNERAAGDLQAAIKSLGHALAIAPSDRESYRIRAQFRIEAGDLAGAVEDLRAFRPVPSGTQEFASAIEMAALYARAGRSDEAMKWLDALSESDGKRPEVIALRSDITGQPLTPEESAKLEELAAREPGNAAILARLGAAYRTVDPNRSLAYYRRAAEIEPRNLTHAAGYGAALVQARRFEEAVAVLRRYLSLAPDDYAAHANLATALNELKLYKDALEEYRWLASARPDLAITYFFIARAHDLAGELEDAEKAYETFLARADGESNRLQIEKVQLRLPGLRKQIKRGEGAKKVKSPR